MHVVPYWICFFRQVNLIQLFGPPGGVADQLHQYITTYILGDNYDSFYELENQINYIVLAVSTQGY